MPRICPNQRALLQLVIKHEVKTCLALEKASGRSVRAIFVTVFTTSVDQELKKKRKRWR
jgi:hypothetical protein